MLYPWQTQQWQQLWHAKQAQRLPHALLLTGISGTGKLQFAQQFAQTLLCQQVTTDMYCNTCHACRLTQGRVHPNILWLEPEKPGQTIKVDQIRVLSEFAQQSALQGEHRVIIIHPAHNMNINAANALLKTLEEPSAGALIMLVSDESKQLPATILSRCQHIIFPRPPQEQALHWLQNQLSAKQIDCELLLRLAHGAPLAAIRLQETDILSLRQTLLQALCLLLHNKADPLQLAAAIQEHDIICIVDLLLVWVMDLLRLQLNISDETIVNQDYKKELMQLAHTTVMKNNLTWLNHLQQIRKQLCTGINLNKQLVLEGMMLAAICH